MKFVQIGFFIFLLFACKGNANERPDENFRRYLKDVFNEEPLKSGEVIYYVINVHECQDCISGHFSAIQEHRFRRNVRLVLVGKVRRKEWLEQIKGIIKRGENVLFDAAGSGSVYNFGLQKPLLFRYYHGEIESVTKIEDSTVKNIVLSL
jgi:hypothetical protein